MKFLLAEGKGAIDEFITVFILLTLAVFVFLVLGGLIAGWRGSRSSILFAAIDVSLGGWITAELAIHPATDVTVVFWFIGPGLIVVGVLSVLFFVSRRQRH